MRVALVNGVCVQHDAISAAVMVERDRFLDSGHEVRVFTHGTDLLSPPDVEVLADPWRLVRDPWYQSADLVVLHFGITYALFDSLVVGHPRAARVVVFHNVTPPESLRGRSRRLAERSLEQLVLAGRADAVWADSEENARVLLEHADVDPERLSVMPLCVPGFSPVDRAGRDGPPVFATVGRFVPSKGLLDLVLAFASAHRQLPGARLVLAGSSSHSDLAYVDEVRALVSQLGLDHEVELRFDVPVDDLERLYQEADVFVSASHHEGFCVPVVEALSAGCAAVVTDAGALPATVGPHGTVVPVSDVEAMAAALVAAAGGVRRSDPSRDAARAAYVERFSEAATSIRMLSAVDSLLGEGH
jgi:glycosyltransferase involved in cell wall biosynthesis